MHHGTLFFITLLHIISLLIMQKRPSLREEKFSVSFFEVKSQTWTPIGHAPMGIYWLTPVPKHGKV